MIQFSEIRGAIFDFDDTLLDNGPVDDPTQWLHSRSRLAALHEVGESRKIPTLRKVTAEENGRAFVTAPVHSLQSAIWNVFYMKGMVEDNTIDSSHPLYELVGEVAKRKDELHEDILREFGIEIPGASDFIKTLAANGLTKHLALATNAIQRDINIFFEKYDLDDLFPPNHIISAEKVNKPKPDPECFDLAFRSLNLPEEARRYTLAFEDNPRGILSAKKAGLFVCAITTRSTADDPRLLETEPDLIAESYKDFRQMLGVPGH